MFYTADKRVVKTGLCAGSADLIGFQQVQITPCMVGKTIAVFRADEIKSRSGKLSALQEDWLKMVSDHGGIVNVVRA